MNRLQHEKSPYLLQHAENPVDWYPWGAEAFQRAKAEEKPVFLSIGYSTCHWCHVMAHESFESEQVAEALNRDFIAVKVDREERPDVDAVYMQVCQAMNGSGGWPLTLLLTPEQKPFYAATYLPARARDGMPGLLELLAAVAKEWKENRRRLLEAGDQVSSILRDQAKQEPAPGEPSRELCRVAASYFRRAYDPKWGGFGGAPKFPVPHNLLFLLRFARLEKEYALEEMGEHTLEQMYRGGLFDHIGGGFSRYSTDGKWLIPHFEKMLYDNALLADVYLEAYALTQRPFYKMAACRTLDYVLRELSVEGGGFACGQDADSNGVEGLYYVFSPAEVADVLGEAQGRLFCGRFGVHAPGNFEGKSVPNLLHAEDWEKEPSGIPAAREALRAYRKSRLPLHRDDKVLTAWNALMIAALARAGQMLGERRYLEAAEQAEAFLEEHLTAPDGGLYARWREGEAAYPGTLEDYAFSLLAFLSLYEATFELRHLKRAMELAGHLTDRFADPKAGGFYLYAADSEQLMLRPKETYDGALPSGNGAAALAFGRLARLSGEERWRKEAERQRRFLAGAAERQPAGHSVALLSFLESLYPGDELICVTAEQALSGEALAFLGTHAHWNRAVLLKTAANAGELEELCPFTKEYPLPKEGTRYYLCRGGACREPVDSLAALEDLLRPE